MELGERWKKYKNDEEFKEIQDKLRYHFKSIERLWKALDIDFPLPRGYNYYWSMADTIQFGVDGDVCHSCWKPYIECLCVLGEEE